LVFMDPVTASRAFAGARKTSYKDTKELRRLSCA